jgi:hypothetical protein
MSAQRPEKPLKTWHRHVRKALMAALLATAVAALALTVLCDPNAGMRDTPGPGTAMAPAGATPVPLRLPFGPGETAEYVFGWSGITAATLATSLADGPAGTGELAFRYETKTLPALKLIWQFQASGTTVLDRATLRPVSSEYTSTSSSRNKKVSMSFHWDVGKVDVEQWKTRSGKTKHKLLSMEAGPDIPGALIALRAQELAPGQSRTVHVIGTGTTYEVTVNALQTGPLKVAAGTFDAVEYDLAIRELTQEEDEPQPQEQGPKYRVVRIWVARDSRIPLKLESQLYLGHVSAELTRYTSSAPAQGTATAD